MELSPRNTTTNTRKLTCAARSRSVYYVIAGVCLAMLLIYKRASSRKQQAEAWVLSMDAWDGHRVKYQVSSSPILALQAVPSAEAWSEIRSGPGRILVLYSYAEADWRKTNLDFFLRHGLVHRSTQGNLVDYVFIINGDGAEDVLRMFSKHKVPFAYVEATDEIPRVQFGDSTIWIIKRVNMGFDFCAWKFVLENGLVPNRGTYKHLVMINASVRGPFLTPALDGVTWIDVFSRRLGEGVGLVGTTINCLPLLKDEEGKYRGLHLQSMVIMWDAAALEAAFWAFQCFDEMTEVVSHSEVGATQAALEAGWGAQVLQKNFAGITITKDTLSSIDLGRRCDAVSDVNVGDPSFPGAYLGGDVHPYELVFIKTNRHLNEDALDRITKLHDNF